MDRLDAMKVFVLAVDEGSLAAAGRKLGRSPAAVSRAIAFLEERVGAELLHRTTRSIKLSEDGERYVEVCRRVGASRIVYILINHGSSPAHVALPASMHEVLTNRNLTAVDLPAQGVAVLIAERRS